MSGARPRSLCPHVFVRGVDEAARFYVEAFGADELFRNRLPNGRAVFVELALGAGRVLLAEESRELGALAPATVAGTPVLLHVEVDDPDAAAERARAAGAIVEMPVAETFWGERYGNVRDPFGHRWALSTAREEFTPDDIAHRTPPDIPP
jgi:PhnB protein